MKFAEMSSSERTALYRQLEEEYISFKALGLNLNITRGKPCSEQLDICVCMQKELADYICEDGVDSRNYGTADGIPEAKRLFSTIFGMPSELVLVGGSTSLNLMYDTMCRAYLHGVLPQFDPWCKQGKIKFLCPVPGYDRHFSITQSFGIEMINVPMRDDGPDMDMVEELVANDPQIKGMWCVPMYSNPDGITYGDEVVRRLAAMKTAAPDFRIFWDNAYCVHHLYKDDRDHLLNLYDECVKCGNEDRVYTFASTSKVTFAGSGLSGMAMSKANLDWTMKYLSLQLICNNNINQLRHARFLDSAEKIEEVMAKHAAIIEPKFRLVLDSLEREIAPCDIAHWHEPKGGYFISFFSMKNCAKRIVALCTEAGLQLTAAGATYPYGVDPDDSNIRIAPTYPHIDELAQAMKLFCITVKMASLEKLGIDN